MGLQLVARHFARQEREHGTELPVPGRFPCMLCGRASSVQQHRQSFLSSCDFCSLFYSPRQLEQRQVRHRQSLCRVCFDLHADGEGQPEPAEQKSLCPGSQLPGNCTHLTSIIPGIAGSVARPNALYAISFVEWAWNWFWNRRKHLYQFSPWRCDSVCFQPG